jgi:PAS domain S-box-containing protein
MSLDNTLNLTEQKFMGLLNEGPISYSMFRGTDFVIDLANEEALKLWGKDKSIIGKKLRDAIPELVDQPHLKILEDVYHSGITYEGKENLVYLKKNSVLSPIYVNFIYKLVKNFAGKEHSILCIGDDVTEQVTSRKAIAEAEERARLAIDSANLGTFDLNLLTNEHIFSERFRGIMGFSKKHISIDDIKNAVLPEDIGIRNMAGDDVRNKGSFNYDVRIRTEDNAVRCLNVQAKVNYNPEQKPIRVIGVIKDITKEFSRDLELKASEKKFRDTVSHAPVGIAILRGPAFNFEMANDAYLELFDRTEEEIIGKNLFDCLPDVKSLTEPFLKQVLTSGVAFHASELEVILNRSGKKEKAWFNLVYEPLIEVDGNTGGIMVVANEVTSQVNSKYLLSQSENQFRKMVMDSPIAMTILKGHEFIIDIANDTMLNNIWRREEKDVIGRSILKAFPELANQQFPELLRNVVRTKKVYRENEAVAWVEGNDGMKKFYLDFEYAPLFDTDDMVSGIIITVYDVTQKVELRQQIAESADRLQMATEGTKLATWDLDLSSSTIIHSAQLAEFFGYDRHTKLTHAQMRHQIHREDRLNIVEVAFGKAMETGVYNYEARVVRPDNSICWIKTVGKVYFDTNNKPLRMLGTMMDITGQRLQDEKLSRLASIVQSTSDAIIAINLDRVIINWNASAERIFGYAEEEIIGKPITTLIPKNLWYQEEEIIRKILLDQPVEHLQTKRKHKKGTLIDISLSISPIKDSQGNIVSISKIARDISKQKRIERLISDNEEKLKILVEASELGTWELGIKENYLDYSTRYLNFMGYDETETPTHEELKKRIHPDDLKTRELAFEEAYKTGTLHYISRLIWRDGSLHWIEVRGKVLYDEAKLPLKIIGAVRDLTDEKRKQQHIEESELRLRTAALSSELGTWDYDPKTETMRWDDASRKLFGVDKNIPITLDLFWERMHADDRPAALDRMMEALNPDIAGNYESEYRIAGLPDNELRWIHAKGKAFFDENNSPYHFSGTVLDITEKRMALEELKDSEQKFRLLADSMPQLIWTGDVKGRLNYFNQSVYDYSGMPPEDMIREGWLQIVHADEREENVRLWAESVSTGKDFLFEHRFKRHDGEYRWQLSRAIPKRDNAGKIQMWVGTSTDIHDQKAFAKDLELKVQERTKDLQQANQELERMNEELASFAYVSSHDLQEPLRKIQTFANRIVEKEVLSDSGKDYFRRMQDAAQRMHLLIEDLLAYSRTSTTEKIFEPTDLKVLLEDVMHDLEQAIREKKASIETSNLPQLTIIPFQFRQLFTNIISNALKFSKQDVPSHITILTEQLNGSEIIAGELEKSKDYWHIAIKDNGIGFAPEYNTRIFEVFQRLHGKHEYKGTGIGLAICKKIMDNHQGSITAVGEPGIGATFHIYVPV